MKIGLNLKKKRGSGKKRAEKALKYHLGSSWGKEVNHQEKGVSGKFGFLF